MYNSAKSVYDEMASKERYSMKKLSILINKSLPVMAGYIVLGIGFGFLLSIFRKPIEKEVQHS